MNHHSLRLLAVLAMLVAPGVVCTVASAATFAVDLLTFAGGEAQPIANHRVVLDNGLFYDFPQIQSGLVTVYDTAAGTVTMLDRSSQVQTILAIDDLVKITAQARAAADTTQKRRDLGIDSVVTTVTHPFSGFQIQFGGATYTTSTQTPTDPTMAVDFARFSDLASRLNLVQRHWLPPFARMTLGDHLRTIGMIPDKTTLLLRRGNQIDHYVSRVTLGDVIESDRVVIKQTAGMITLFREVTLEEFPVQ